MTLKETASKAWSALKWNLFSGVEEPEIPGFEAEHLREMAEAAALMEEQQEAVLQLLEQPAWKLLENYRTARIEVLRSRLERMCVESEEAQDLRAELRVLRGYENFLFSRLDFGV